MTKRIFRSIFLVSFAVFFACLVLIMGVLYSYFTAIEQNQLMVQTSLAAQGVSKEGMAYFDGLDTAGYRLTWIAADGTVLYDTNVDAAAMENHSDRKEVQDALQNGSGESQRYSATLAEKTLYRAQLLSDGSIIRVSVTQYTVLTLLLGMLQPILIILALAIILSVALAKRLSRRIVAPLNQLNLDQPLENDVYEELSPLLTRIEHQHRHIRDQLEELKHKRSEFATVTDSMSEGLILLNEAGVILSINPAAARLFGTDTAYVGRDMLTVDRSVAMQHLLSIAQAGQRGEIVTNLMGGQYQINASPVLSDLKVTGIVLLAFNVTQKVLAEQQRREFTANVSHELKTPLQSILGAAELIENQLVKSEDLPAFAGRIRTEASRLVTLIDDIIRLSQLDEGAELPQEDVDLKALADEVAQSLTAQASTRNITIRVLGERAVIKGVRRLLWEIIYNLCDNAIKYNVPNGQVNLAVSLGVQNATLTVADTGIGIPTEQQSRVFERFYRVDKSHSKQTGGTGLGLSIVKHAAQYHGAAVELQSEPGKGTSIQIRFPLSGQSKQ